MFHGALRIGVVNLEFEAPHDDCERENPGEERKAGRWSRGLRHGTAAVKNLEPGEEILACITRRAGEPSNSRQLAARS